MRDITRISTQRPIAPPADRPRNQSNPTEPARDQYVRSLPIRRGALIPRIVGPLVAIPELPPDPPPSPDPDLWFIVPGLIAAGLIGLIGYLIHYIRKQRILNVELPLPAAMYTKGIPDNLWYRYLNKLVYQSGNRNLTVQNYSLRTRNGRAISLLEPEIRRYVLRMTEYEERRAIMAQWSRIYQPPLDLIDIQPAILILDELAYTLDPTFSSRRFNALPAIKGRGISGAFVELTNSLESFTEVMPELADIYEPALIARYLIRNRELNEAGVMLRLFTGRESELKGEDIAGLLMEQPSPDAEVSLSSAIIHMYFARTLIQNFEDPYARSIAACHINATKKIMQSSSAEGLDELLAIISSAIPSERTEAPPSLNLLSPNWKLSLGNATLGLLSVR